MSFQSQYYLVFNPVSLFLHPKELSFILYLSSFEKLPAKLPLFPDMCKRFPYFLSNKCKPLPE